jgi:hypothetical protein
MINLLVKIANTVPEDKITRLSIKELELKRAVSDEPHLKTLKQLESIITKK